MRYNLNGEYFYTEEEIRKEVSKTINSQIVKTKKILALVENMLGKIKPFYEKLKESKDPYNVSITNSMVRAINYQIELMKENKEELQRALIKRDNPMFLIEILEKNSKKLAHPDFAKPLKTLSEGVDKVAAAEYEDLNKLNLLFLVRGLSVMSADLKGDLDTLAVEKELAKTMNYFVKASGGQRQDF